MSVRRTTLFLTAAGAAVLIALSGCAADGSDNASSSRGDTGVAAPQGEKPAQDAGAGPVKEPNRDPNKVPDNLDVENRSIIYAGTMTVRVDDVDAAAAKAIAFATGSGGFVGGDNRQRDDRRSRGTLVLRIPAEKFTTTLDQLKTLGNEEDRSVTAQDVTDQVVDVDARLRNAQASVDRIRTLLAKAQTISEITSLESELSRRESDLESLQARKRRLDGLTALSTITLVLLGPEAALDEEETGPVAGFKNGMSAFLASLEIALTVLGWLVPWVLLLGVPIYLLIRLIRRFRPRRPAMAGVPTGAVPGVLLPATPIGANPPGPGNRPAGPGTGPLPPFPANRPASAPPVGAPPAGAPSAGAPPTGRPTQEAGASPTAGHPTGPASAPPATEPASAPPATGPASAAPATGPASPAAGPAADGGPATETLANGPAGQGDGAGATEAGAQPAEPGRTVEPGPAAEPPKAP